MKLQQLKYIVAVADRDLSVTAAADALHTAQPGVSKQIRLLEDELGLQIFERSGKNFSAITAEGQRLIEMARPLLAQAENIKTVAEEFRDESSGSITIATTHTQARYALPETIQKFRAKYPKVSLHIQQGAPKQIAAWASRGEVDFCIATEAMELFDNLVMMPCYHWNRCVLVKPDNPLANLDKISIKDLATQDIITYVFGFTGRSKLDDAFARAGLDPNVVLTAVDADVIKTYVRLGLGAGIVANMAYDPKIDSDLVAKDTSHLFAQSTTRIGFRSSNHLRGYMVDFIELFAPHLTRTVVDEAVSQKSKERRERYFNSLNLKLPSL